MIMLRVPLKSLLILVSERMVTQADNTTTITTAILMMPKVERQFPTHVTNLLSDMYGCVARCAKTCWVSRVGQCHRAPPLSQAGWRCESQSITGLVYHKRISVNMICIILQRIPLSQRERGETSDGATSSAVLNMSSHSQRAGLHLDPARTGRGHAAGSPSGTHAPVDLLDLVAGLFPGEMPCRPLAQLPGELARCRPVAQRRVHRIGEEPASQEVA